MKSLPLAARIYVLAVVALGGLLAARSILTLTIDEPAPFVWLLLGAIATSVLKVHVPMPASSQPLTLSLAFAANFAALLLLDGSSAMIVAVIAAWTQTTFNTLRTRNPWHRTVFNMAALALTMAATELTLRFVSGHGRPWGVRADVPALGAAAATYYLVNSGVVAGALSERSVF